jgi:hypothetical protein
MSAPLLYAIERLATAARTEHAQHTDLAFTPVFLDRRSGGLNVLLF